jgi:hypothetical protein
LETTQDTFLHTIPFFSISLNNFHSLAMDVTTGHKKIIPKVSFTLLLICEMGGMRRHSMHSLQEFEEVSEQNLPWACRGHSTEGIWTGSQMSPSLQT